MSIIRLLLLYYASLFGGQDDKKNVRFYSPKEIIPNTHISSIFSFIVNKETIYFHCVSD